MKTDSEIRLIADRMIELRPREDVVYRPYRKENFVSFDDVLSYMRIDLAKLYPDAEEGDIVFVKTILLSSGSHDIIIRVRGNAKVIFNNAVMHGFDADNSGGVCDIPAYINKGENELIFICRKSGGGFGVDFVPSINYYPGMWAKDYMLNIRAVCPLQCFKGEDGAAVSEVFKSENDFDGSYIYPQSAEKGGKVDLSEIFPDAKGDIGFAYTECVSDTELRINAFSECDIKVNGKERQGNVLMLKKGDKLLVSIPKDSGFAYDTAGGIGIPFMSSYRKYGGKWLTISGFDRHAVFEAQFKKPYNTAGGERVFWKLEDRHDYLRPYVDSCFYAQWFYAVMVGHLGLKKAGEAVNEKRYADYFIASMKTVADFYLYMRYEHELFGMPSFMQRAAKPCDLDSIGTMGMNMCELFSAKHLGDALAAALSLYIEMRKNIPVFKDGTFNRGATMWADDTFMSCPFLLRLADTIGNAEISDFAARQLLGFKKYLYMDDKKLFSHIYFTGEKKANRVPWGRGNGWAFVTLSEALELLPETSAYKKEITELFVEFADGLKQYQGKNGLWHQVLDREDSYEETSCTAMFIIGLCRGVRRGVLGAEFVEIIKKAHDGIIKYAVDRGGNVYGVCRGSGCSMDPEYYMRLGTAENDDHGTGIVLWALSEIKKLGSEP